MGFGHSQSYDPWNSCEWFLFFFLSLTHLLFQGLKLNDWNLWVQLQVQGITLRVVIWKMLFFLEYKKHICLFSVERQAGWLYQSRLWFCFSLTSLLLHSTRCWAMGRTWSHLHQAGVWWGKKQPKNQVTRTTVRVHVPQQKCSVWRKKSSLSFL